MQCPAPALSKYHKRVTLAARQTLQCRHRLAHSCHLKLCSLTSRSTGTQTTTVKTTTDVGVGTSTVPVFPDLPWSSTPTKTSLKRPRLHLVEEEDEDSSVKASSSFVAPEPQDSTYNPEDSVTVLSQWISHKLLCFREGSSPTHQGPYPFTKCASCL